MTAGVWRSRTLRQIHFSKSQLQTRVRDPTTRSARVVHLSLAPKEGVGNAGCPLHPRPRVHFVLVERTRVTTSTPERPAFPHAMVLTAYVVLSPVTGLFCHRRQRIWFCLSPVGPTQLRELDASVGASGPHDFAVRSNISRRRAVDRSRIQRTRPAIPSRAKRCRVHRIPCPTSVTIAIRPSVWDGMRNVLEVIWGVRKQKYFFKQDWTAQIRLIHFNKFACARKSAHGARANSARVPDAVQRSSRCSAEPGPTKRSSGTMDPGSAVHHAATARRRRA